MATQFDLIFGKMMDDRKGTGIRSQFPGYYLWNGDMLILIHSVGVVDLRTWVNPEVREFNSKAHVILIDWGMRHYMQPICAHSSQMEPIEHYRKGNVYSTWKAIRISIAIENWMIFRRA